MMRRDIAGLFLGLSTLVIAFIFFVSRSTEEGYLSSVSSKLSELKEEFKVFERNAPSINSPLTALSDLGSGIVQKIKNTTDKFQFEWVPYLRYIYETKLGDCFYAHNKEYKHNYTDPLLSCDTNFPERTEAEKKAMTRKQIHIWCEGTTAFSRYEEVPMFTNFTTIGDNSSRECLHHYINQHCYDQYPIPNIVHWLYYGNSTFNELWKAMAWYSVFKIMKPCLVIMHGTHPDPGGVYWDKVIPLGQNIIFIPKEPQRYTKKGVLIFNIANQADIGRLEVLKEFGGLYLDFDQIILKPVDIFRAVAWSAFVEGNSNGLTNSVMFVRKGHPFLDIWLKNWETYDGVSWDSHSIVYFTRTVHNKPTKILAPGMVQEFGPVFHHLAWWPLDRHRLYKQPCDVFDAFGQHLYHKQYPKMADIEYIKTANTTFGILARYLFFNDGENCKTKVKIV